MPTLRMKAASTASSNWPWLWNMSDKAAAGCSAPL